MTTSNDKPRAATDDALNLMLIAPAANLGRAMLKYDHAVASVGVLPLGWEIIALDLKRYSSSDTLYDRATACERLAESMRAAGVQ